MKRVDNYISFDDIKKNEQIKTLINSSNKNLEIIGYTEHGLRHTGYVSTVTAMILRELGYSEREVELGAIAGYLHDIGNSVNRKMHGLTGATLSFDLLKDMKMPMDEIALIIGAIGNHEEEIGTPVNPISAALIIADKSDTHRTRVRKDEYDENDIHDRVNWSIKDNKVVVDKQTHLIRSVIDMDNNSAIAEYVDIYLTRIALCEKAASFFGYKFSLEINSVVVNRHVR